MEGKDYRLLNMLKDLVLIKVLASEVASKLV